MARHPFVALPRLLPRCPHPCTMPLENTPDAGHSTTLCLLTAATCWEWQGGGCRGGPTAVSWAGTMCNAHAQTLTHDTPASLPWQLHKPTRTVPRTACSHISCASPPPPPLPRTPTHHGWEKSFRPLCQQLPIAQLLKRARRWLSGTANACVVGRAPAFTYPTLHNTQQLASPGSHCRIARPLPAPWAGN